jgi:hypothetical protein
MISLSGRGNARAAKAQLVGLLLAFLALFLLGAVQPTNTADAASQATLRQYRTWMEQARVKYPYPQSVDKMYRVMMCESSGNANVSSPGGTYKGLFQYHTNTWRGRWNPYRNNSIWDAKSQIFATAKAWSVGMQSHWSCYYLTSGR